MAIELTGLQLLQGAWDAGEITPGEFLRELVVFDGFDTMLAALMLGHLQDAMGGRS
jgi:hypothetical protein